MTDPDNVAPRSAVPETLVPAMEGFAISKRDQIDRSMDSSELTMKDKAIRATRQGVLDDRTDAVLRDLIRLAYVTEIHGVVSTGKEANVYGAVLLGKEGEAPTYRALKIYKTRILAFKDRERYIGGEYRFQKGATKGYAMVQLWAQKEYRNLSRLQQAKIPCPEPIVLRGHTILMEFLGKRGISYPKLVDAVLQGDDAAEQWTGLYVQLLGYMRRMYHVCRLVHADLSEYNILYHDGLLYVIDVSQSVEPDHPKAYEFLRMDIKNVNRFFERRGVTTLRDRALFDFIFAKDGAVAEPEMGEDIRRLIREAPPRGEGDEEEEDEEVFRQQYIPQNVHEISDLGDTIDPNDPLISHLISTKKESGDGEEEEATGSDSDSEGGAEVESGDEEEWDEKTPRGHKFEDRDEKKARKQAVKEEKREKRKVKMPKHVKKQIVSRTARK
ncbi:related to extragenic suppressor of the bimD6 mutation [Cephalotrichum gorgonifer]|uniref:Serine/threonine-protein kinase RIO1 n=1 Tax=Cephalotrichum gorgonifer TaxID=2041049 RepID=A0AAE8MW02_9PEZI|nr:related to extragenic suppressor of the bimD6 mutation [Cephalotrichum gorgonifer]